MNDLEIAQCKALASALLVDALEHLEKARSKRDAKALAELIAWFKDDSVNRVFAFVPVCQWLGLDASAVRARIGLNDSR